MWKRMAYFLSVATAITTMWSLNWSCADPVSTAIYIATISNTWNEINVPEHTFSLASEDDGKTSGTFTGEETIPGVQDVLPIKGEWKDNDIMMTLIRNGHEITYRGKLTHDKQDTIRFSSPSLLVICRNKQ